MPDDNKKVWLCTGTPEERKAAAAANEPIPPTNYRMIRSSIQTLRYLILDSANKVVEYVLPDELKEKYLIKGKDPKKRNIYVFTSNVAEPDLTRTKLADYRTDPDDPKSADPLDPRRVQDFAQNVQAFCAQIKEYDSCTHVSKDGREVKRIVTMACEADGKTPLDIITLMETGILDALKLRGQKQCNKKNRPRAIEKVAALLGQTLAPSKAKVAKEEEVDEDWEPEVTDSDEE